MQKIEVYFSFMKPPLGCDFLILKAQWRKDDLNCLKKRKKNVAFKMFR
jgi:hypothetical protein